MVNVNDAFPGQYLRAADLKGRTAVVTIKSVGQEDIGGEHKLVAYFEGKDRGLVLNKTNAFEIANMYGEETNGWVGRRIELFSTRTDLRGKMVDAIRVRAPGNQENRTSEAAQAAQPQPAPDYDNSFDDEIPF